MTSKQVSEEEFEKILEDLRRELSTKLAFLNKRVLEGNSPLCHKLFGLEYYVVSPLYYRLQRHLIDWGTRSYHPQLPQYPDKEALLR